MAELDLQIGTTNCPRMTYWSKLPRAPSQKSSGSPALDTIELVIHLSKEHIAAM